MSLCAVAAGFSFFKKAKNTVLCFHFSKFHFQKFSRVKILT
jgi:hypothetical protein